MARRVAASRRVKSMTVDILVVQRRGESSTRTAAASLGPRRLSGPQGAFYSARGREGTAPLRRSTREQCARLEAGSLSGVRRGGRRRGIAALIVGRVIVGVMGARIDGRIVEPEPV